MSDLPYRVHADEQIIKVETLTPFLRSRLVGATIINRLILNGTWKTLKEAQKDVVVIIACRLGVATDYCVGLAFEAHDGREQIAEIAGILLTSTYRPVSKLIEMGVLRCFGTRFELIMPTAPWGEEEELLSQAKDSLTGESWRAPQTKNSLMDQNQRAPWTKNWFMDQNSEGHEPLQNTDLRAPWTKNWFMDQKCSVVKNVKSDSCNAMADARATDQNGLHIALALKLKSYKALEALNQGRSIAEALMIGGMRPPQATVLARHANATREQVIGAIRKCERMDAAGELRYFPPPGSAIEAYITSHIKRKYRNPPPEHELQMAELPEHEQEIVGSIFPSDQAERSGGAALLIKPIMDPLLASLANDLIAAAPNAQADQIASQKAAEAAKVKIITGQAQKDQFTQDKERVEQFERENPERFTLAVNQVIDQTTDDFLKTAFTKSRGYPTKMPTFVAALVKIIFGGQA